MSTAGAFHVQTRCGWHATWAMFNLISDATTIRLQHTITLSVSGADMEDLLMRWLSALLYLYGTQRLLCCTFMIA